MTYELSQIFEGEYPPEAAEFCNQNSGFYIAEIEASEDGTRRFQIVQVPDPTIDEVREKKLGELDAAFTQWRGDDATLISSLGFEADADERAMLDIAGLVARGTEATFMDAENVPHALTAEQLVVLQGEIITASEISYGVKWTIRTKIEEAQDVNQLESIDITFTPANFTKA